MIYAACEPENLTLIEGGLLHCSDWQLMPVTQSSLEEFFTLTPEDFGAGLSATLGVFALGFAIGVVISVMKKAR
ncbi:MAG: hypothetical protein GXZ05_08160 [Gammaproteobacteria bacterium]|nr:hypothetical protein [Gammaproteobacteria bacterium]